MAKWQLMVLSCFLLSVPIVMGNQLEVIVMVSSADVFDTTKVIPAMDLALETVHNWSLPFNLSYNTILDSECKYELSIHLIHDALDQPSSSVAAVIGCGCSAATRAVTSMTQLHKVPLISYASTSPSITNDAGFLHFLRMVPSSIQVPSALAAFVNFFEWTQVLLVSEGLAATFEDINSTLTDANITTELEFPFQSADHQASIVQTDKRIFILDTNIQTASKYLCQSYWSGKYYPSYAWLIVNNFAQEEWWNLLPKWTNNCTKAELNTVLNYSVVFHAVPGDKGGVGRTSESGLTLEEFKDLYKDALTSGDQESAHAVYAYDSILTLALALNATRQFENDSNASSPVNLDMLSEELRNTRINGVSGMIEFDTNGDRQKTFVEISQLRLIDQGLQLVKIAQYEEMQFEIVDGESVASIWPNGTPSDGVPIRIVTYIHYAVMVFGMLIGLGGEVFAAIILGHFIYYRETPVIKLTSPNLNYIIMFGAACMYLSVILYSIPGFTQAIVAPLCEIDALLAGELGYSLCFCVTLVKIWRVYYIFNNPQPRKRVPKDWHLILAMLAIFLPELVVNLVLLTVDFSLHAPELYLNKEMPPVTNATTGEVHEFYIWECNESILTLVDEYFTVTYKAIQHAAALYMTFQTRKIKITVLNDYRWNTIIVCTNSALMIVLLVTLAELRDYPNAFILLITLCIFTGCTVFIGFGFVPKIVLLYQDPEGKSVFQDFSGEMKQSISIASAGKGAVPVVNHSSIRSVIDALKKTSEAE